MIYFDHASGGLPGEELAEYFKEMLLRYPCNQEAIHAGAMSARNALRDAGVRLLTLVGLTEYRVIWGSSATELFLILSGFLSRRRHGQLILSHFNHPALNMALSSGSGCDIDFCPVLRSGIDFDALPRKVTDMTVGIALPQVNSELGLRFDFPSIASVVRQKSDALLLCDAVQAFGKEPLSPADAVIVSGHKLGAPASAALLYRPERLPNLERFAADLRTKAHMTSRPEVPALLTMVRAAELRYAKMTESLRHISMLNTRLRAGLAEISENDGNVTDFVIPAENASPYIVPVIFPGRQSAILLRMLSENNICVGAGSACEAENGDPSAALLALGYHGPDGRAALRISFAPSNTPEEVDTLVAALKQALASY